MTHTSGPWTCDSADWNPSDGTEVRYYVRHDPPDISKANSDLIAAAPDLLNALKQMREACAAAMRVIVAVDGATERFADELERAGIPDGFGKRAGDAIAKAEGGA